MDIFKGNLVAFQWVDVKLVTYQGNIERMMVVSITTVLLSVTKIT